MGKIDLTINKTGLQHNIEIARLPLSICCHVGPGTIGAAVCVN